MKTNTSTTYHSSIHPHSVSQRFDAYPVVPNADALLIRRPKLERSIHQCLEKRLLLMIAPPGFGKTTSLMQAFSSIEYPVVWYTVRESDVDSKTAAENILQAMGKRLGADPIHLPQGSPLGYAHCLTRMISRFTDRRVYIVLDSIDRCERPEALTDLIQHLLDKCPATCHFVIASTTRPPLKLSRFARMGELSRIKKEDLSLTQGEVEALLSLRWDHQAAHRFAREVLRLSSGCAANVCLMLLAWRKPPLLNTSILPTNHNAILVTESIDILNGIGIIDREILFTMSLLPKFDKHLVSELCGHGCSAKHIDNILNSIPVIKVPDDRYFSLAPALSDSLCALAEVEWTSEKIAGVKERAARIFELRGELKLSLVLFLDARSTKEASRVLDHIGISDVSKWDSAVILAWEEKLGSEKILGPAACYVKATAQRLKGNFACAIEYYNAILNNPDWKPSISDQLCFISLLHRLQVSIGDNEAGETRSNLFAMEADSPSTEIHLRGIRGRILTAEGFLDEAFEEFKQSFRLSTSGPTHPDGHAVLFWIGYNELKRGNYRAAFLALQEFMKDLGCYEAVTKILALQVMGSLHELQGEFEPALARFRDALEIARDAGIKLAEFHLVLSLATTDLNAGNVEEASELIETAEFLEVQLNTGAYTSAILAYHKASLAWELGEKRQAIELMREVLNTSLNEPYYEGWLRLYAALLLFRSGSIEEAQSIVQGIHETTRGIGAKHLLANASLVLGYISYRTGRQNDAALYQSQFRNLVARGRYEYMPSSDPELIAWINAESSGIDDRWRPIRGPQKGIGSTGVPSVEYSVCIHTLGKFEIVIDGKPLDAHTWHSRNKSKLLFQILLSHASKTCSKDGIIEYLWPDADMEKGKKGIHTAVWALRKILKETNLSGFLQVEFEYGDYRLVASPEVFIDHETFRSLISRAQTLINKDDVPKARGLLLEAVKLYRGDFIHDTLYERFADTARTQFFDLQSYCLTTLARFSEDIEQALDWWRQTIRHDPYSEEAYQGHIETCVDNGLTREALDSMEKLRKHIVQELDLPTPDWANRIESRLSETRLSTHREKDRVLSLE